MSPKGRSFVHLHFAAFASLILAGACVLSPSPDLPGAENDLGNIPGSGGAAAGTGGSPSAGGGPAGGGSGGCPNPSEAPPECSSAQGGQGAAGGEGGQP